MQYHNSIRLVYPNKQFARRYGACKRCVPTGSTEGSLELLLRPRAQNFSLFPNQHGTLVATVTIKQEKKLTKSYKLMVSLLDRQPTFLAETEWKSIPFSGDGPSKTILDLLVDILVEFPGVLAAIESLRKDCLSYYALAQLAFKLTNWVRRLIYDLEKWKEHCLWTYPAISLVPHLEKLNLLALCRLGSGLSPYDPSLAEALNCYAAAHLILTRIARGFAQKSAISAAMLRPPHSPYELIQAIVHVSGRHIDANDAGLVSLVVTTFALRTAVSTTELDDEALLRQVKRLLDQANSSFGRKFNIRYSVSFEAQ